MNGLPEKILLASDGWPKGRTLTRQAHSPGAQLAGVRQARRERHRKGYEGFVAMGGSAGVAQTHEVAEGKTHMSDGVASSEMSGSRRTT